MSNPKAVLVGTGRLQLGLIGAEFRELGYDLIGLNFGDYAVVERIQKLGYYRISFLGEGRLQNEVEVKACYHYALNFSREQRDDVLQKILDAKIVNFGLGQTDDAITIAANFLLELLTARRKQAVVDHLFVTCSDNPVGDQFGVDRIQDSLIGLIGQLDSYDQSKVRNDIAFHLSFVQTLADRICTRRVVPANPMHPVDVTAERYAKIIFHKSFEMTEPLLLMMPEDTSIFVTDNIEMERKKKYYTFSLAHSMCAYLGYRHKKRFIHEAIGHREIMNNVRTALDSVVEALSAQFGVEKSSLKEEARKVFRRLGNKQIEDEVARVARDVPRKLQKEDRLLGPLSTILRHRYQLSVPILSSIIHSVWYSLDAAKHVDDDSNSGRAFDNETLAFGRKILGARAGKERLDVVRKATQLQTGKGTEGEILSSIMDALVNDSSGRRDFN